MTETKRRQGQKGATPKELCPTCGEYLKTAGGRDGKVWRRVGLYCPSSTCDYIAKDFIELEDMEEGEEEDTNGTDKADKIKKLTIEFVKKHEELNKLAEQINELEKE